MAGWQIRSRGGEYTVTAPDGTQYEVAAHLEYESSPTPEDDVRIDRITSNGVLLHDGRRILAPIDSEVTSLVEDAVLSAEGW